MPAASDPFTEPESVTSPSEHAAVVTPSDSADLTKTTKALYIGAAGDVTVNMAGGETSVLFKAVPVGTVLPIRVTRVMATGTASTSVVALW